MDQDLRNFSSYSLKVAEHLEASVNAGLESLDYVSRDPLEGINSRTGQGKLPFVLEGDYANYQGHCLSHYSRT